MKVKVEIIINDDNGYDDADLNLQGMGNFANTIKQYVSDSTYGDLKADTVIVDGISY